MGLLSGSRRSSDDPRLLEAAKRADVEAIRALLEAGVNPDVRDVYRYTPLMSAVSKVTEYPDRGIAIDLLLAAGADVNAVEQAGQTALIHAAHANNVDAAHRLLGAGADVELRAANARDAFHIAFDHGNLALARVLAKAELGRSTCVRRLLCTVVTGDATLVRQVLAEGEGPGATDGSGLTPLHAAALVGDPAVVDALVSAGAGVDASDFEGVTPLIHAARAGHREVVLRLVEQGAATSPRMRTLYGDDALSAAARAGHGEIVCSLVAGGADVNATGRNGSALTAAASGGHEEIVAFLLAQGAAIRGVFALHAAVSSRSPAIVQQLLAAGADPDERIEVPEPHRLSITPLMDAVVGAAPRIVALLIEAGADVNARDTRGDTVLILLAEVTTEPVAQVEIARILLAAGADVNALGEHQRTAFYMATHNKNSLLAEALLRAGANPALRPDW